MKKHYLLSMSLALAGTLSLSAQQNFSKPLPLVQKVRTVPMPQYQAKAEIPLTVKYAEDFSKFTAGTEAVPDGKDIGGNQENANLIDAKYLQTPGWYGAGVHQAGGTCALKRYEYQYPGYDDVYTTNGYIASPISAYFGDIEVTFRAKKISDDNQLWVGLCDNDTGPVDSKNFTLTDEWQEFVFTSVMGTFNDNNVIQFSPQGNTEMLIDDIVIKRAITKTEAPVPGVAINKSFEEFVATWYPTETADKYRLNIYKKVLPTDQISGTLSENFDQIQVQADGKHIDTQSPNYPAGWTIDVSSNGKQDVDRVDGHFNSAPQSIVLDEVGDYIESPETPAPINHISFWVRASNMEDEYDLYSMFSVNIWDSSQNKWTPIANMPNYFFEDGGMIYEFNADQIGLNITKLRLEYIQKGDKSISFNIDDLKLDYKTQMVDVPVLVDHETTDTFYVAKDIAPDCEHYYYVQAMQGDLVSNKTIDVWVDGITGLKPVVNEATHVTETGFDISWTKFYNARDYSLNLYKAIHAKENLQDAVILDEKFDRLTDGTVDFPHQEWYDSYDFADNGLCDSHWISFQPQWAAGMIGTKGTNMWTGMPGFIASPALDLHNNGGAFNVEFTVHTTVPNDTIVVMIMPDLTQNASVALMGACKGNPGQYTMTAPFPEGGTTSCHVAFMSYRGYALFLDEVKMVQNLNEGESVTAPFKAFSTVENQYSFTDLPAGCDYAVDVVAKGMKNYAYYTSEKSDPKMVYTTVTAIENALVENQMVYGGEGLVRVSGVPENTIVQVYNLQGQLVKALQTEGAVDVDVEAGVYLVKVGQQTTKVLVK